MLTLEWCNIVKADPKTQTEVTQAFKGMFEAYKKQDQKAFLSYWTPDLDVLVIGSGIDEKRVGLAEIINGLERDWAQGTVESIGVKNFAVSAAGYVAWLSADVTFHGKTAGCGCKCICRFPAASRSRGSLGLSHSNRGYYETPSMFYIAPSGSFI